MDSGMQLQPSILYQIPNNDIRFWRFLIGNCNRTSCRTIQGVIGRVISSFPFEITSPITPALYDTKSRYQLIVSITKCENLSLGILLMFIKVSGTVSFIPFSFPVEAGSLTWSIFFIDFDWYSANKEFEEFHWLVVFPTWFSLVL